MNLHVLSPEQWSWYSENAHVIAFGKQKPAEWDRIDFALMVTDLEGTPVGYGTIRETRHDTVYWQHGGSMPGSRDTARSFRAFQMGLEYLEQHYKNVTFLIENTNTVMLKFAMKAGFRIIGVRNFQGSILVEHLLEFSEGRES